MAVTAEQNERLNSIKQRVLAGQHVPDHELKEAIEIARSWRASRAVETKAKKSKGTESQTPKPSMTMDDLNALFAKKAEGKAEGKKE